MWTLAIAFPAAIVTVFLAWVGWKLIVRSFYFDASCPNCGSIKHRTSSFPSALDRIFRWFTLYPVRCLGCGIRYHNAAWSRLPDKAADAVWTAAGIGQEVGSKDWPAVQPASDARRPTPPRIVA